MRFLDRMESKGRIGRRVKILILTIIITTILAQTLKVILPVERPCQMINPIPNHCPTNNAYPSGHASIAFSFVYPFLGSKLFFLFYPLAIIVGYWRVFSGVHTWFDIAGSIATAALGYSVAEAVMNKEKRVEHRMNEIPRQFIHISVGILMCIGIWVNLIWTFYVILIGTIIGMLVIQLELIGLKLPVADYMLDKFERKGVVPGEGSLYYAVGVLFIIGLLRNNPLMIISLILILSLGDGLATLLGKRYGKYSLPWNRNKTFEGTIGFIIGGIPALLLLQTPVTLIVLIVSAFVESLPIKIDDNLTIPVIGSIIFFLL